MKLNIAVVSLTVAVAFAGDTQAAALYDNLAATTTGLTQAYGRGEYLANSFSTGSTSFRVTSVSLLLFGDPLAAADPNGVVTVTLSADAPNTPGPIDPYPNYPGNLIAVLGTISEAAAVSGAQIYSFSTSQLLAPKSVYWIGLTASTSDGVFAWAYEHDQAAGGYAFDSTQNVHSPLDGQDPYQMRISGAVVPKPASWALMLVGFDGLGAAARTRRVAHLAI